MKPPSRRRLVPLRFWESKKSDPKNRLCTRWHRQELENLLYALKQQNLDSELDYLELRKKVPKLSLLEIQKMIKSLKSRVGQQVHLQIRKQRCEEQKTKVPIEMWAELAKRMAGDHEETVSSAFSQMLVIAATEPCSLLHSDPPRSTNTPDLLANNLQTIQMRPMSHPGSESPSTPPPVIILPGRNHKTPVQSRKKNDVSNPSAQTSTTMSPLLQSSLISCAKANSVDSQSSVTSKDSAELSIPSTSKSIPASQPTSTQSQSVSEPTPLMSTSSAATATVSQPSQSNQMPNLSKRRQSQQACQSKQVWAKFTVDFEKIYRFMSDINSKNCNPTLTAMESAVLLDLLMALPEELPLLDCKELQHHLLHVQRNLKLPLKTPITEIPNPDLAEVTQKLTSRDDQHDNGTNVAHDTQKAVDSSVQKATEHTGTTELQAGYMTDRTPGSVLSDEGDWAAAGLCPLNPFMVPLALLKQQVSQESDQL